eukprot:171818_1
MYYKNIKYKEVQYKENEDWQKVKYSLNLEFPNVPYLIDEKSNLRMTESSAIGKYLAKRYNIGYNTDKNNKESQIEGVVHDILIRFFRLCYNKDFEKVKIEYIKS